MCFVHILFLFCVQVVVTTPNNPSGYIWPEVDLIRLIALCKSTDAWLVADQTYFQFLHEDAVHVFPCGANRKFYFNKIIHIFSFSKIFGMPGWRVGFMAYPKQLTSHMRKVCTVSVCFLECSSFFFYKHYLLFITVILDSRHHPHTYSYSESEVGATLHGITLPSASSTSTSCVQ